MTKRQSVISVARHVTTLSEGWEFVIGASEREVLKNGHESGRRCMSVRVEQIHNF